MVDFQKEVNKIRARGKSLSWIADRCGCSVSAIAMLSRGLNHEPRYGLGVAILELEKRTRKRK